jgi:hypothetical protein
MSPTRRSALAAGLLYLATIVSSIPALALIQPILTQPDYVLGDGPQTRVVLGIVLDLVNVAAAIGTAVGALPDHPAATPDACHRLRRLEASRGGNPRDRRPGVGRGGDLAT